MMNKKSIIKILSIVLSIYYAMPINAIATSSDASINWPHYDAELSSAAAFVMDADSSYILYEYNSDKKLFPASLTKIMTAIIVLEKVNGNYDDLVTFSYNAVTRDIDKNSVTIGASAGDQLSVKDCLYSLLLPSANDVANALAEYIAGSINDFVSLMNEKVENLGLSNTHFVNPSGLHDDNQYTTASDMAKILQYAMTYPIFLQISSSISYTHAPIRKYKNPNNSNNQVLNTNSIAVPGSGYYYRGITSGKTGHTTAAGYNLAASANKNNMNLICVVLGSKSEKIRYNETASLFDFHFSNYRSIIIKDFDKRFNESISTMSINDVHLVEALDITCNNNARLTLPANTNLNEITSKISFQVDDKYNKYAIGSISYYLNDKYIGRCTIEGRNLDAVETIYTNHLNLSSPLSENGELTNANDITNLTNNNVILYINNGKIILSKTLITSIIVFAIIISILIILLLLYSFVITNKSIPTNRLLFRIRKLFKR